MKNAVARMNLVANIGTNFGEKNASLVRQMFNRMQPHLYGRLPCVYEDSYHVYCQKQFLNKVAGRGVKMLVVYVDDIDCLVYEAFKITKKLCDGFNIKLVAFKWNEKLSSFERFNTMIEDLETIKRPNYKVN